jgi:hypothetical protein
MARVRGRPKVIFLLAVLIIGAMVVVMLANPFSGRLTDEGSIDNVNDFGNWDIKVAVGELFRVESVNTGDPAVFPEGSNYNNWEVRAWFKYALSTLPEGAPTLETATGKLVGVPSGIVYDTTVGQRIDGTYTVDFTFDEIADVPSGLHSYAVEVSGYWYTDTRGNSHYLTGRSFVFELDNRNDPRYTPADSPVLSDIPDWSLNTGETAVFEFQYMTTDSTATYMVKLHHNPTDKSGPCVADGVVHKVYYSYSSNLPMTSLIEFIVTYDNGAQTAIDSVTVTVTGSTVATTTTGTINTTTVTVDDIDRSNWQDPSPKIDHTPLIIGVVAIVVVVVVLMVLRSGKRR